MKNVFLLPRKAVWIGWGALIVGLITGVMYLQGNLIPFFDVAVESKDINSFFERETYQWSFALTFVIIGLYLLGFSRKKIEDEFIEFTRYQALIVAILLQSIALVISSWFVGGLDFVTVMMINLIALLFVYNLVFVFLYFRNQTRVSE